MSRPPYTKAGSLKVRPTKLTFDRCIEIVKQSRVNVEVAQRLMNEEFSRTEPLHKTISQLQFEVQRLKIELNQANQRAATAEDKIARFIDLVQPALAVGQEQEL